MSIQWKIAWCSDERSKPWSGTGSWSGSLPKSRFGKQISKGLYHWKEIEKASKLWNRDAKKKSRGMLERSIDLFRTRK